MTFALREIHLPSLVMSLIFVSGDSLPWGPRWSFRSLTYWLKTVLLASSSGTLYWFTRRSSFDSISFWGTSAPSSENFFLISLASSFTIALPQVSRFTWRGDNCRWHSLLYKRI